jgi:hypothetical protein
MDIQGLYQLFQATIQPDPNVRIQAELKLKQVKKGPFFSCSCTPYPTLYFPYVVATK